MDCSICTRTLPYTVRQPRNLICTSCFEGARRLIAITNELEMSDKEGDNATSGSFSNSSKGLANALKLLKKFMHTALRLNDMLIFMGSFDTSFRDQIHTDIQLKPGNNGHPIPAHKALLASRSEIFKNMLDSDECKSPSINNTITLPELNHDELQSFLEFLYTGTLPKDKAEKHVYSLSIAADKYNIPFLQKFCENRMLGSLNSSNALDVLEISDHCSNKGLKESALNFIVKNMEDVVFSDRFDVFVLNNPHLSAQITRASFMNSKTKRRN